MKKTLLLLIFSYFTSMTIAQTTLSVGDVALVYYNATTPDEFGFVTFVDLEVNTRIYFSENGATDAGVFDTGEGVLEYIVNAPIVAGTVIGYPDAPKSGVFTTTANSFSLSTSGDQIFVFQDTDGVGGSAPQDNPTFISAVNGASQDKGDNCDFTDNQETDSPSVLTPVTFGDGPGTFLALGTGTGCDNENDFLYFNGSTNFSDVAAARDAVLDPDNWVGEGGGSTTSANQAYEDAKSNLLNNDIVLPIELIAFTAKPTTNQQVWVEWKTQTELANDYMEVERSENGKTFKAIGRVQGAGTTLEIQEYTYLDEAPKVGQNYYRLKQVDFNGMFEYSDVVSVKVGDGKESNAYFMPNPSSATTTQMVYTAELSGQAFVSIIDMTGKEMRRQTIDLEVGENLIPLELTALPTGIYFVRTVQDGVSFIERLVVE